MEDYRYNLKLKLAKIHCILMFWTLFIFALKAVNIVVGGGHVTFFADLQNIRINTAYIITSHICVSFVHLMCLFFFIFYLNQVKEL